MPALDSACLGPPFSTQGFQRLDFLVFANLAVSLGSLLSTHSPAHIGLLPSTLGVSVSGFNLPVLSCGSLGLLLPVQSSSHLESSLLAMDLVAPGSLTLLRSAAKPGSPLATVGSRAVRGCALLVFDVVHPGSLLPLHGFACMEPSSFQLGAFFPGSSPPPRAFVQLDVPFVLLNYARTGLLLSVLALGQPSTPLPPRSFASVGPTLIASGMTCLELLLSVLDVTSPDVSVFVRSLVQTGMALPVSSQVIKPGPVLLLRASVRLGPSILAVGLACIEPPLAIPRSEHCGSILLLKALARLDFLTPFLDVAKLDPFVSSQQLSCLGTAMLSMRCSRLESSLFPLGTCVGTLPFPQSSSKLGVSSVVVDAAKPGPLFPLQSCLKLESLLIVPARARIGATYSVESSVVLDSSTSLRSLVHLGFALSVVQLTPGSTMLLQATMCLDFSSFLVGLA
eukprot:s3069_g8.t1